MPTESPKGISEVRNGDQCRVTGGTHAGKTGIVLDKNISKTGAVTITVKQQDGTRFKTLTKNVVGTVNQ